MISQLHCELDKTEFPWSTSQNCEWFCDKLLISELHDDNISHIKGCHIINYIFSVDLTLLHVLETSFLAVTESKLSPDKNIVLLWCWNRYQHFTPCTHVHDVDFMTNKKIGSISVCFELILSVLYLEPHMSLSTVTTKN